MTRTRKSDYAFAATSPGTCSQRHVFHLWAHSPSRTSEALIKARGIRLEV